MKLRERGWRPALRIARRQVRRSLGRSILVAVLVGIPVAGATMADVLLRTTDDPQRWAYRDIGDADAVVEVSGYAELPTSTEEEVLAGWFPHADTNADTNADSGRDAARVDVTALLPPGTEVVPDRINYSTRVGHGDVIVRSELQVTQFDGPLTEHAARLDAGRWPESGDEVLVSTALAERLELTDDDGVPLAGATLTLPDGPELQVAGTVIDPFDLRRERVVAAPGSQAATFAQTSLEQGWGQNTALPESVVYLVDLPADVDAMQLVMPLAAEGVRLIPRDVELNPEHYFSDNYGGGPSADTLQAAALVALVVGLGLLEVILLAGAAFAVGARRQVRDLGLMAAGGASARQIRRTVLAQGLVLGILGAATGVVVGVTIAVAARPLWERMLGEVIDSWRFSWIEIAAAAVVGVLSGLAAAIVPAVGAARMKPVDALAQRFRTSRMAARLPLVGVGLIALGAGGALLASRILAGELEQYGRTLEELAGTGAYVQAPSTAGYITIQIAGAVLVVAGLVATLPGLISALARGAHRLGVSPRLALRDAARHRHRTAPAIAAITIVVAGSTALAFGVGGAERADELRTLPGLPDNVVRVDPGGTDAADTDPTADAAGQAVADVLPEARIARTQEAMASISYAGTAEAAVPGCAECGVGGWLGLATADPDVMELVAGRTPTPADLDAVAAGEVVVYDESFVAADGTVTVEVYTDDAEPDYVTLPGHPASRESVYGHLPGAFASAETLAAAGIPATTNVVFVAHGEAGPDQVDAALAAGEAAGAWVYSELPDDDGIHPAVLALTVGSAFVTLVGVAIAVSLAAVEGRADLATLAAVGAPPRRRRSLAGAQALVVGGVGVLIGSGLGVYFAYLIWPALGAPEFVWAWETLALTGLVVPTLAVLVAVICTPSRLPMIRRLE